MNRTHKTTIISTRPAEHFMQVCVTKMRAASGGTLVGHQGNNCVTRLVLLVVLFTSIDLNLRADEIKRLSYSC